jgi:ubiquinone/menaquinone biosynthesis C-methylase UbiE
MWSQGDYTAVALLLEPCAVKLADASGISAGMTVLDVAAGNGNFALAAATRGARVIACDLAPRMIELGRARTERMERGLDWIRGDAEDLPFHNECFELVATVFGAMFAPRPDRVASEMFRVCRRGGKVVMASYSSDGFLSSMSSLFVQFSTPVPFEVPSPFEWGDPAVVKKRFAGLASAVELHPETLTMTFESVDAGLEFWERTNAPTIALRTMLPPERYAEFQREARQLMATLNASGDHRLVLNSSYLNVVASRPVR